MKALASILVILFLAAALAGCGKPKASVPKTTPIAPRELSLTFRGGPVPRLYEKPFIRLWDASLAALEKLNLQVRKTVWALGQIEARDPEGNPVILELKPKDSTATYLEILTVLGNERITAQINAAIRTILENADSPSEP